MPTEPADFKHLYAGGHYAVVQAFTDYDGIVHPAGESWTYTGSNFLPYEDGLSLFVTISRRNLQIRLQWRPEAQGGIIDQLEDYVQPVS